MKINFNPSVSFRKNDQTSISNSVTKDENVKDVSAADLPIAEPELNPQHKNIFKEAIADIAKFFTSTNEMTKGSIKAAAYGFIAGTAVAGWKWVTKALPKAFSKNGSLKEVIKHPAKSIGWKANLLAGTAALGVASYQIIKAKLTANKKTADIDHQLYTGHRTL